MNYMKLQQGLLVVLILEVCTMLAVQLWINTHPKATAGSIKTIEHRIEGKETVIENVIPKIINQKEVINMLVDLRSSLEEQLDQVKNRKDTFQIIQIQDTLISVLKNENYRLNEVVVLQDSVIQAQRFIINSKDTIIAIAKADLKRIKKQRNWSLLANGVLSGLLIVK